MSYLNNLDFNLFDIFDDVPSGYFWGGTSKILFGVTGLQNEKILIPVPAGVSSTENIAVFPELASALSKLRNLDAGFFGISLFDLRIIIAYENGSIFVLRGINNDSFVVDETIFSEDRSSCFSRQEIISAWSDAIYCGVDFDYVCQKIAILMLHNLLFYDEDFSGISIDSLFGWEPKSDYAYIAKLSEIVYRSISTLMLPKLDVDILLSMLNNGYAVIVSLPNGAIIPECSEDAFSDGVYSTGSFIENAASHCIVLVRDDVGIFYMADECGVRIIDEKVIRYLDKQISRKEYRIEPWRNGCLLAGIRKD